MHEPLPTRRRAARAAESTLLCVCCGAAHVLLQLRDLVLFGRTATRRVNHLLSDAASHVGESGTGVLDLAL